MSELNLLRTEVAQLREACKLMFPLVITALAPTTTSGQALAALLANVGATNKERDRGEVFDELSVAALLALSSVALKQHPNDTQVLETYRGLRPGARH
jgi:hypothetical protein